MRSMVVVIVTLALAGCVGALQGGTIGGGRPGYVGWVDAYAAPGSDVVEHDGVVVGAIVGSEGHAKVEVTWRPKKMRAGDALNVGVTIAGTRVDAVVRPGYVTVVR